MSSTDEPEKMLTDEIPEWADEDHRLAEESGQEAVRAVRENRLQDADPEKLAALEVSVDEMLRDVGIVASEGPTYEGGDTLIGVPGTDFVMVFDLGGPVGSEWADAIADACGHVVVTRCARYEMESGGLPERLTVKISVIPE